MLPSPASEVRRVGLNILRSLYAALVTLGWFCAVGVFLFWLFGPPTQSQEPAALAIFGAAALGFAVVGAVQAWRGRWASGLAVARDLLVLGALPTWGLALSHQADSVCRSVCGGDIFRPLAEPEVWAFLGLHVLVVLAYAVARRRASLPAGPELLVQGALIVGLLMQVLLAVHFGRFLLVGLAFAPLALPACSPVPASLLYGLALWPRLRAAEAPWRALNPAGGIVGIYGALHALWLGEPGGALRVFTRTCDWTLSTIPVEVLPGDCHYLCTVAARGHPGLVRPLRLGRRRGVTIVVNRQLAVANAFEDLLHQRWPGLGRVARTSYDRLALPVCNYLRPRWVSDLVYLFMKPAEWAFYLSLLLLDPGDPERRIDAMYR